MELVPERLLMKSRDALTCSICIANYNGVALLEDCIASIRSQNTNFTFEIIIHDDASTDGSAQWIRTKFPSIKLIESTINVGFCTANNRMAAIAEGQFILLLNNDAALLPGALQALIETALGDPNSAILTLPQYDWDTGKLVDRGCLLDPFYNPVPNLDPCRVNVAYAIGACMFLHRDMWRELGGFPAWMKSLAEDMYVCCLARLSGKTVTVVNSSGYRHRQGASFGGNRIGARGLNSTYRRRLLSECNKTATLVICTPLLLVWPLLAAHLTLLCLEGLILMLLKRSTQPWRKVYGEVLGHTFKNTGEWVQQRKLIQRTRNSTLSYFSVFTPFPQKLKLLLRHGVPKLS